MFPDDAKLNQVKRAAFDAEPTTGVLRHIETGKGSGSCRQIAKTIVSRYTDERIVRRIVILDDSEHKYKAQSAQTYERNATALLDAYGCEAGNKYKAKLKDQFTIYDDATIQQAVAGGSTSAQDRADAT